MLSSAWKKNLTLMALALGLGLGGAQAAPEGQVADLLKQGEQMVREKRLDDALESYKSAFGLDSQCAEALFNIGWLYNEQNKHDTAVRWLKKATEIAPQRSDVQNELGYAYYKLNNADGAVQAYTRATQLQTDKPAPFAGLGDVLYEQKKDYEGALKAYAQAVEKGSNSAAVLLRLGWCHNHFKHFDQAQPILKKAAEVEPKSPAIWLEWGYSLLGSKQADEAVQALTRATVLDPEMRLGHLYLGRAYLQQGKKALVKGEIEKLRGIDRDTAASLEAELQAQK